MTGWSLVIACNTEITISYIPYLYSSVFYPASPLLKAHATKAVFYLLKFSLSQPMHSCILCYERWGNEWITVWCSVPYHVKIALISCALKICSSRYTLLWCSQKTCRRKRQPSSNKYVNLRKLKGSYIDTDDSYLTFMVCLLVICQHN